MALSFDSKKFLTEQFRSSADLVAFVTLYRVDPPREAAVDKWFRRASIPSDWLPVLLALLQIDRGSPVSLTEYLTEEAPTNDRA